MSKIQQTVSLWLGPELGKDFKVVVDAFFGGDYNEALRQAVVLLVKKEKLSCHNFDEKGRVALAKIVDKVFHGDEDQAVTEALNLLLEKHKVGVDE